MEGTLLAGTVRGAAELVVPLLGLRSRELPTGAMPYERHQLPAPGHKKPQNQLWKTRDDLLLSEIHH